MGAQCPSEGLRSWPDTVLGLLSSGPKRHQAVVAGVLLHEELLMGTRGSLQSVSVGGCQPGELGRY